MSLNVVKNGCLVMNDFLTSFLHPCKYDRISMGHILHELTFKRIQISSLDVNKYARPKFQCSSTCSKYEACASFYVDDGACVFGLRDDVTELANGDDVMPADWQLVKVLVR